MFSRFNDPKLKKALSIVFAVVVCASFMLVGCFAVDSSNAAVTEPDLVDSATSVFDAVHEQLNFTNILAVLGIAIGAGAALFMLWWAVRKVVSMIKSGMKGKLNP